jgi:hypothetical protein
MMPRRLTDDEQFCLTGCRLAAAAAAAAAANAGRRSLATPTTPARSPIAYTPDLSGVPPKMLANLARLIASIERRDAAGSTMNPAAGNALRPHSRSCSVELGAG